jgi:glycosyltransferase involved in cell wall biosynthesis
MTTSVLIPSFRRPHFLERCLDSLACQSCAPDEVLVVWQGDDFPTRDIALAKAAALPISVRVLHSPENGVVPAENLALDASTGEIILLIDDDAVAPTAWVERHISHYQDATVGAVGGPADDFNPDGSPFPKRAIEPIGRLTWYGKSIGNMYDHVAEWRSRPPIDVDHLVGYNLSLRRSAFERFEIALRPYWNMFELDACLQVKARGFRVLFDFGNVVEHHPTNTAYVGGRHGDLTIKCVNPSYNHAFVLARRTRGLMRWARFTYLLLVGTIGAPGLLSSAVAAARFGSPGKELRLLGDCWRAKWQGWRAGTTARRQDARQFLRAPLNG